MSQAAVIGADRRRGVSKAAFVHGALRAAIVGLELRPGTRIDKTELCARLGVSRQPLAEAIARLAAERLVDVEPQRGTFVARIRLADLAEAAFVRRAIEVSMVEVIAEGMDAEALDRIDRILRYQAAAVKENDAEEFYALDLRFHLALFDRLAMRRVIEVVETSRAQLERARRLLLPRPRRIQVTLREHQAVFEGLAARDGQRARTAMAAHLDKVMHEVRSFAAEQPDLFAP